MDARLACLPMFALTDGRPYPLCDFLTPTEPWRPVSGMAGKLWVCVYVFLGWCAVCHYFKLTAAAMPLMSFPKLAHIAHVRAHCKCDTRALVKLSLSLSLNPIDIGRCTASPDKMPQWVGLVGCWLVVGIKMAAHGQLDHTVARAWGSRACPACILIPCS